MALYDEFTTPAKVNAQIDAKLNSQRDEQGGIAANDTTPLNLDSVSDFSTLSRNGRTSFYVKDVETGGLFTYKPSSDELTPDGEDIFALPNGDGFAERNYRGIVKMVLPAFDLDNARVMTSTAPDGKIVKSNVLNPITGGDLKFKEITSWADGSAMSDAKIDGNIFIKYNGKYFADTSFLEDGAVRVGNFGAKGDGTIDDTLALISATSVANSLQAPLVGGGRYLVKNTIYLRRVPSADLDLIVADDFEDQYVVSFANVPSRSRNYTIRIDGRNIVGVTGIELHDPTIAQLSIKAILYRLERGIHVYGNAEKLKIEIFAYQCGIVLEEQAVTEEGVYHTPDENAFNITGSGCNTWYLCSAGTPSTTVNLNVEGNFIDSEKSIIIEDLDPPSGVGKLITLRGTIRGFQCGLYINNPEACINFSDLFLCDGGRVESYTEEQANAILPAVKIINARTITGRLNLRPTYVNLMQIDRLLYGGDLDVMVTNFRANGIQLGNLTDGSVTGLKLNIHASAPQAIFDNYILKVLSNVSNTYIDLVSTGKRKVILDSEKISLKIHSSFFEGGASSGVFSGTVNKLPILIDGDVNPISLQSYIYKIKGMRAFNKMLQRWVFWNGLNWQADSFSTFGTNSIIVNNPIGGILDTSTQSNVGALVIKFPYIPISGAQGLYELDLEILDYGISTQSKNISFKLSGTHGLSSSPTWDRTYAAANDFYGRNLLVKFGFNSEGYPVILIGDETTTWDSSHFQITKVKRTKKSIAQYDNTLMDQQWSLSIQTDLSEISIQKTSTDTYYWGDYNKLINKAKAAISADSATAVGATYSQSEVQAILTELRDLKTKMRTAGLLAT